MNIILINTFFAPIGGAEKIAYLQLKLLEKNGHNVVFWATDYGNYFEKDYIYKNYFTKFCGGMTNYLKNPMRYYYNNQAKLDLQILISNFKPDLIHLHNISTLSPSILDVCKKYPTVMTVHDASLICPSHTLMKDKTHLCNIKCKNGNFTPCIFNNCANNIEKNIRYAVLSTIKYSKLKYIDHFITPSESLRKNMLIANIGIIDNHITTINNFLDKNELDTQPNYSNNKYFLYVGRLSPEKGINYLLDTICILPREINFHIVGNGPDEKLVKKYIERKNLTNVKFLGFMNKNEIKEEYQNCIATILPCNWFENFPTTTIESFINGKPVIASNIGGISEQVVHNKTGLLFEPTNVKQLKECILKYWNNSDLVVEHGKNAYIKATKFYTEDRYYNKLIDVYNKVVEKKCETNKMVY